MSVLSVRGVRKSYDAREVVCGVDLAVSEGECFGLLGPNGAGKTTTLKLCLGLTDPDGGEIRLLGEPVPRRARQARARVGVVPQFDNLDPDFTVAENLVVFARYFGIPGSRIQTRIPELLEFAGLGGRGDVRISALLSSFSWTSRPPGSIRRRGTSSGSGCAVSPRRARRSC
jgi:lipooligosaccharide transport system ATP-binding protein